MITMGRDDAMICDLQNSLSKIVWINRPCKSCAYSNSFGTTLVPYGPTYIDLTHEGNKLAHFNGSQCLNTRETCTVYYHARVKRD